MYEDRTIVVVGGGLAGLVVACRLARAGRPVLVLEAAGALGGRARAPRLAGLAANLGPHALYVRGALAACLASLGIDIPGGRPRAGDGVLGGFRHPLPAGPRTLLGTPLVPGRSTWAFLRAMATLRRSHPRAVARLTVAEALGRLTGDRSVRRLVAAFVRLGTYADAPDRMSADVAWTQLRLALGGGVRYVDGGWQTLVDRLAACARSAGARIETGRVVAQVTREPRGPRVHLRSGATIDASAVVAATGPRRAARLLGSLRGADRLVPSASAHAACIDLVVEGPAPPPPHLLLGIDEPYYASVHSAAARLGPSGRHLVCAAAYLPIGARPKDGRRALAELEAWLAVHGRRWHDRVVAVRRLPFLPLGAVASPPGGRRPRRATAPRSFGPRRRPPRRGLRRRPWASRRRCRRVGRGRRPHDPRWGPCDAHIHGGRVVTRIADATRAAYLRHRDALVGHLYRMTGEAAEAEDLVQEAFRRALERPPADLSRDLGGYLFRIATRLGIDHLRRVRRRRTAHLRLPEPWPAAPAPHVRPDAETRYEIEETASLAFLHALDVLTPMQRATLLLRDVYGFTTQETAEALGVSQGAVKQHLRRGRRTLAWRRPDDPRPPAARRDAARRLFDRAMARLLAEDVEGFAALLAEGATALSDGDGQYAAAPRPVVGREKVAALYGGLVRLLGPPRTAAALWIGGDPAVLLELTPPSAAFSPAALVCATTEDGERIRGIFTILAPRRLTRCAPRD